MFSLGTVLVFAVLALLIGITLGALAFRRFGGQSSLEQRLRESEQQLKDYQADVTEHFAETSRRVNDLTRSYKEVHEYLASSAMKLTNPQMSRAISQAAQQNLPGKEGIEQRFTQDTVDAEIDENDDSNSTDNEFYPNDDPENAKDDNTNSARRDKTEEKEPA